MPDRSNIAKRMKRYERVSDTILTNRTPVILRLDGRAFHSFCRGFERPFDKLLIESMQDTMKYLCENIENVVLGYHQSDEISLVIVDYKNINISPWFDNRVQKMCSIAASMATLAFNKFFNIRVYHDLHSKVENVTEEQIDIAKAHMNAAENGAMFDCRAFNLPKDEVTNYFYWRQQDAMRNSINMVGQANFLHIELQHKNCNDIKNMLLAERNINYDETFPIHLKRGSCCIKETYMSGSTRDPDKLVERSRWFLDVKIPIFINGGRQYINNRILYNEDDE